MTFVAAIESDEYTNRDITDTGTPKKLVISAQHVGRHRPVGVKT